MQQGPGALGSPCELAVALVFVVDVAELVGAGPKTGEQAIEHGLRGHLPSGLDARDGNGRAYALGKLFLREVPLLSEQTNGTPQRVVVFHCYRLS